MTASPPRVLVLTRRDAEPLGLSDCIAASGVVVTCTPSRSPLLFSHDLRPGTFVAADLAG
jgi:ornithine cyclodeaminase/alanine dehydrogenase-like protein (mu-crystallin family)